MLVVLNLVRRIDSANSLESFFLAVLRVGADTHEHAWFDPTGDPFDVERFEACEAEGSRVLSLPELQRQHSHAHEIAAVNPLVAFGYYSFGTQQPGAFRRPVPRRARTILFAGKNQERNALVLVLHRRVVNGCLCFIR